MTRRRQNVERLAQFKTKCKLKATGGGATERLGAQWGSGSRSSASSSRSSPIGAPRLEEHERQLRPQSSRSSASPGTVGIVIWVRNSITLPALLIVRLVYEQRANRRPDQSPPRKN